MKQRTFDRYFTLTGADLVELSAESAAPVGGGYTPINVVCGLDAEPLFTDMNVSFNLGVVPVPIVNGVCPPR